MWREVRGVSLIPRLNWARSGGCLIQTPEGWILYKRPNGGTDKERSTYWTIPFRALSCKSWYSLFCYPKQIILLAGFTIVDIVACKFSVDFHKCLIQHAFIPYSLKMVSCCCLAFKMQECSSTFQLRASPINISATPNTWVKGAYHTGGKSKASIGIVLFWCTIMHSGHFIAQFSQGCAE